MRPDRLGWKVAPRELSTTRCSKTSARRLDRSSQTNTKSGKTHREDGSQDANKGREAEGISTSRTVIFGAAWGADFFFDAWGSRRSAFDDYFAKIYGFALECYSQCIILFFLCWTGGGFAITRRESTLCAG